MTGIIDSIIHGDCVEAMKQLDEGSVDFILTDPPYITNYRDRTGRTVINDDNDAWLAPAYAQMYRALKPNAVCVSFYGWGKADLFIAAWKNAGFRVSGHIVFRKRYSSRSFFLQYHHEQAYLLTKGRPARPAEPPPDVIDWTYTGNRLHPTQKPIGVLRPIIAAFTEPGELVLDPFCGSGSTLAAASELYRRYIGIELDKRHHATAVQRLATAHLA